MVDIVEPLEPTGLNAHDVNQFKDAYTTPTIGSITNNITDLRLRALDLFKKKVRHGQVFYEVSSTRDGIRKLSFIGWIKLLNGSESAVFQIGHAIETRSTFLRDLRDADNAPLTGYYLERTEAEKALADYYRLRLDALEHKPGHTCKLEHGDYHPCN